MEKMMRIFIKLAVILIASLLSAWSIADSHLPRVTMTVTLLNQSNNTLTYRGLRDANPENIVLVSPKVVLPGNSVTITTVSNNYNVPDLSGNLYFQDSLGKNHAFHVSDAKQMHYGNEAHFVLNDVKCVSQLIAHNDASLAMTYSSELL
jgi:hypothetical protein